MIAIVGLIILSAVSVFVFSGWLFARQYCLTATKYLSTHPLTDFLIHIFTGLGFGWLVGLWISKTLALLLGAILVVVLVIMRYAIPTRQLPEKLRSSGMGRGLPVGICIAWLSSPWIPEILTLILGAISMVGAETLHYIFPNLVAEQKVSSRES